MLPRLRRIIRPFLRLARPLGKLDGWDASTALGVGLVVAGLWWIYPPVALILLGLALASLGWWGSKVMARPRRPRDEE